MKLCEEFLKEMNLENDTILDKAIACEMLKVVIVEPTNKKYWKFICSNESDYFPDDVLSEPTIVRMVDVCGYWSNDIADILAETLIDKGINSPLANFDSNYKAIFSFLDNRVED